MQPRIGVLAVERQQLRCQCLALRTRNQLDRNVPQRDKQRPLRRHVRLRLEPPHERQRIGPDRRQPLNEIAPRRRVTVGREHKERPHALRLAECHEYRRRVPAVSKAPAASADGFTNGQADGEALEPALVEDDPVEPDPSLP